MDHLPMRSDGAKTKRPRVNASARLFSHLLTLALLGVVFGGGCSSSQPSGADAENGADEEAAVKKKKPDYEIGPVKPLLSETIVVADSGDPLLLAKPGHWTSTVQTMRANYDDLDANNALELLTSSGKARPLSNTPFLLEARRPAVLAKGRPKRVTGELYLPQEQKRMINVRSQFDVRGSGRTIRPGEPGYEKELPWLSMPSYQYFLLVFAAEPDRYAFLKLTDAIRMPWEDDSGANAEHYRVVLADSDGSLPAPASALNLTSVAYLVWDGVDVERLDEQQRRAIVDWVYWGGRLIVNGPDSLPALRGSFLDDLIPVTMGESIAIDDERLEALNEKWSHRDEGDPVKPVRATRPWSGVSLIPKDEQRDRELDGTGGLFFERAVGAGSVVVSAFQLAERDFVNWKGFDGFLNGALLRRPARQYQPGPYVGLRVAWSGVDEMHRLNAYFTTPLRWMARDVGTTAGYRRDAAQSQAMNYGRSPMWDATPTVVADRPGGLGSW
ncbi:MAG: hypothetical protein AAF961_10470, partial [Planctomycetota bacterium]